MEGFTMNAEKGHSQSADNSQLLAHKSSSQGGHAFKLKAPYKPTGDQPQAIEEKILFSPHIGGITASSFRRGYAMIWENIQRLSEGKPLLRVVNLKK